MNYTPNRWVVLQINNGSEVLNKVLAGWYGGYIDGDYWKLNSGNVKELEFDDRWEFHGYSGSVYVCYKRSYGMNGYMTQVLDTMLSRLPEGCSIKILESFEDKA